MAYLDHLIHRARIERSYSGGTDNLGQPIMSWAVVANDVPCRLVPLSGREIENATVKGLESVSHKVLLPPGTDVNNQDKIVINEETYEVEAVLVRSGTGEHHKTAIV